MRAINRCNSLPPGILGVPSVEAFKESVNNVLLRWSEDSCTGQGFGLEDLQDPLQTYYFVFL